MLERLVGEDPVGGPSWADSHGLVHAVVKVSSDGGRYPAHLDDFHTVWLARSHHLFELFWWGAGASGHRPPGGRGSASVYLLDCLQFLRNVHAILLYKPCKIKKFRPDH